MKNMVLTDSDKIKLIKWKMQDILIDECRPVKNTTRKQCYEVLEYIQGLLETNKGGNRIKWII